MSTVHHSSNHADQGSTGTRTSAGAGAGAGVSVRGLSLIPISSFPSSFSFGRINLDPLQVFAVTQYSFAVVNLMPLLPGHILVLPRRVVARVTQLADHEMSDLWLTAHRLASVVLEPTYHPDAFTFAIQDGAAAGQTIPHVHVHILPRHEGDFKKKDDIYDQLDTESRLARAAYEKVAQLTSGLKSAHACCGGTNCHEPTCSTSPTPPNPNKLDLDAPRVPRTLHEMATEAQQYRDLLYPQPPN